MTVSETSKQDIVAWLGDSDVSVVNVGNGCSAAFRAGGPTYAQFKDYFIYVGALRNHKNFSILLDALRLRPEYRLVVVSDDPLEVRRRGEAAGVQSQLTTMSNLDDEALAALYRGSLGLLFPSLLEGFGLPAVEAMRSGKRVAYWRGCASVAEIVGASGAPVGEHDSAEEWANAMDDLITAGPIGDPETRMSAYSWESVATKVRLELASAR